MITEKLFRKSFQIYCKLTSHLFQDKSKFVSWATFLYHAETCHFNKKKIKKIFHYCIRL